ncbi:MAG: glycosyltransferase family 4 protein [Candidatus Sedimenticola sp. (ex Thyasira tokunagai)]
MIVIVTQCFPPRIGGIESVMSSLADAMFCDDEDIMVIADSKGDLKKERDFDQTQSYVIKRCGGLKLLRNMKKRRLLGELAKDHTIKAVITDSWKSLEAVSKTIIRNELSVFCFAHGNDVLPCPGSPKKEMRIRQALSHASKIIAVSKSTGKLVEYYIPAKEKCIVIYNIVPQPKGFNYSDAGTKEVMDAKGEPTLLTLGRIEPRKGHDHVIRSLPALRKVFPRIKYWIAGSGADRSRLEKMVEDLNVSSQVVFWGSVNDAMKNLLLKHATLMAMPNRHEGKARSIEGYGLVYIEAAYHRLPVVAGRSGGAVEAVSDGETGVLCNGNDSKEVESAIMDCLQHVDQMSAYAERGYSRAVERHDPSHVISLYKALWE